VELASRPPGRKILPHGLQYGRAPPRRAEIEVDALRIVQADEGVRRRLMSPREASLQ